MSIWFLYNEVKWYCWITCVGIHVALLSSRGIICVVMMAMSLNFEVLCQVHIIEYKHTNFILGYRLKYRNSSAFGGQVRVLRFSQRCSWGIFSCGIWCWFKGSAVPQFSKDRSSFSFKWPGCPTKLVIFFFLETRIIGFILRLRRELMPKPL